MTILEKVKEAAETLKTLDQPELTSWAKENGMDNRAAFSRFKKALLEIGVDYDELRRRRRQAKREAMESAATASLTLYSDAKARLARYAVCDKDGDPVWYGIFFEDDRDFDGEQSSGELAAAKKAIWLAGKVREALGLDAIRLTLRVDAEWLCWANAAAKGERGGGKARVLTKQAERYGVLLTVEWIAGEDNPADKFTVTSGFQSWRNVRLSALVDDNGEA